MLCLQWRLKGAREPQTAALNSLLTGKLHSQAENWGAWRVNLGLGPRGESHAGDGFSGVQHTNVYPYTRTLG